MQKKWVIIVNVIILIGVMAFLVYLGLTISSDVEEIVEEECVEVNKVASFVYDTCYDAYTKTIFVSVERSQDNYHLKSFDFSFFDIDNQFYNIIDVPNVGGAKAYKIPAEKNPENLNVRMNILKDFSASVCQEPRILFVKYCPSRSEDQELTADISPFSNVDKDDFIEIGKIKDFDSDVFAMNLVDKEAVWENKCLSSWTCEPWEECDKGVQRRMCDDAKDCYIPTKKPETVKYCDGTCVENWECLWSECSGGFTTPDCRDLNSCGTTYELPQKLSCGVDERQCTPDIICGDWTGCEVDYNFLDLVGASISDLTGSKSRICVDNNKCSTPQTEVRSCSVNIDVYTKRFKKCGKEYIGVYNRLDNDLIARIDVGTENDPHLNLFLDDQADSEYCDYCFNGKMDVDEEGIDCGGGCMECSEKYEIVEYSDSRPWWQRIF